jgi:hypothetical protein
MARKTGLGFYPTGGTKLTAGDLSMTGRLELPGTWNATSGNVLGTRVVAHRIYDSWYGGVVEAKNAFADGSNAKYSFDSGHVVLWSTSKGGSYPTTGQSFYAKVASGALDDQIKSMFNRIESLDWGGNVVPIYPPGSSLPIPGSTFGGKKPTELWYLFCHEPNINTGGNVGTPDEFAQAMFHMVNLYDGMTFANGKHIKFAICLSNPSANSINQWYGVGTGHDLTKNGTRPLDGAAWDIYYPFTENSSHGPVTATNVQAFDNSSKYPKCHNWTLANMPTNTPDLLPEYACRLPTSPVSGGDGPAPNYPATWYNNMISWLDSHKLPNGDHPIRYMCQFIAGSIERNSANGGGDNSIMGDQTTYDAKFQVGGVKIRPSMVAYHDALITLGNPSLPGSTGSPGVTPTGVTAPNPAAGVRSTSLSWTVNAANVSYNIYKDGQLTQSGVTASPITVYSDGSSPLPQTHQWQVSGVGTNGVETALSAAATVNFTAVAGTPPATPGQPTVSSIGQFSAVATVVAPSGTVTGYNWFVDGGSTPYASSTDPTVTLQGLTSDADHTVTCLAYNDSGASAQSPSASFHTLASVDVTPPSVPANLGIFPNAPTADEVDLVWSDSTDPDVAGAVTSGLQGYMVYRSDSPVPNSGQLIGQTGIAAFKDTTPNSSSSQNTDNYYSVASVDNSGNVSDQSAPFLVTIPATAATPGPQAFWTANPSGPALAGQAITFDLSESSSGTDGAIQYYWWKFGDGITTPKSASPSVGHTFNYPGMYRVTGFVQDNLGVISSQTKAVVVYPTTGSTLPFTGAPLVLRGAPALADDINNMGLALDSAISGMNDRLTGDEAILSAIGNPSSPRRHGLVWTSIPVEAAQSFYNLQANTYYVIRASTLGASFDTVWFTQIRSGVSGVSGAFFALYDVAGNLLSPSGALTDASAAWQVQGNSQYTLDGGPYVSPMGADDTDPAVSAPTYEFFLAFWLGAVGATVPQVAISSGYGNAINLGSTSPITPSQADIFQTPIFATAQNKPTTSLTPPPTLGQLTLFSQGILLGLS